MYFNRDFRDGTSAQQSKRDEWAQGFMLNLQSGYTDGTVGFGVDALGMLGVKLDSSPDRTGTGLLPTHDDGRAADEYSKLGLTGKVKISATELKIGSLIPELPILKPNDGRILPQTFEGGLLTSKEIKNLTFTGGRLDKAKDRDSTNYEDIALNNKNSRFAGTAAGKHFDFGGVDYKFTDKITGSYHFAQLDDVYNQHFLGLVASRPMGPGTFATDLRLAISDDQGAGPWRQDRQHLPQRPGQLCPERPQVQRRLPAHVRRQRLPLCGWQRPVPGQLRADQRLCRRRRTLLAGALRLRLRQARHSRPELHEPLPER